MAKAKDTVRIHWNNAPYTEQSVNVSIETAERILAELPDLIAAAKLERGLPPAYGYRISNGATIVEVPNNPGHYVNLYSDIKRTLNEIERCGTRGLPLSYWVNHYGPTFTPIYLETVTKEVTGNPVTV